MCFVDHATKVVGYIILPSGRLGRVYFKVQIIPVELHYGKVRRHGTPRIND